MWNVAYSGGLTYEGPNVNIEAREEMCRMKERERERERQRRMREEKKSNVRAYGNSI